MTVDLTTSPFFLERIQAKRNIAFIKTHKTASSALRHVLERYGERYDLRSLFKEFDGNRQGYIPSDTLAELDPPYELSTRHLRYDPELFESLMPRPIYISIVREPLELAFSHYHYMNPTRLVRHTTVSTTTTLPVKRKVETARWLRGSTTTSPPGWASALQMKSRSTRSGRDIAS